MRSRSDGVVPATAATFALVVVVIVVRIAPGRTGVIIAPNPPIFPAFGPFDDIVAEEIFVDGVALVVVIVVVVGRVVAAVVVAPLGGADGGIAVVSLGKRYFKRY